MAIDVSGLHNSLIVTESFWLKDIENNQPIEGAEIIYRYFIEILKTKSVLQIHRPRMWMPTCDKKTVVFNCKYDSIGFKGEWTCIASIKELQVYYEKITTTS